MSRFTARSTLRRTLGSVARLQRRSSQILLSGVVAVVGLLCGLGITWLIEVNERADAIAEALLEAHVQGGSVLLEQERLEADESTLAAVRDAQMLMDRTLHPAPARLSKTDPELAGQGRVAFQNWTDAQAAWQQAITGAEGADLPAGTVSEGRPPHHHAAELIDVTRMDPAAKDLDEFLGRAVEHTRRQSAQAVTRTLVGVWVITCGATALMLAGLILAGRVSRRVAHIHAEHAAGELLYALSEHNDELTFIISPDASRVLYVSPSISRLMGVPRRRCWAVRAGRRAPTPRRTPAGMH